MEQHIVSVGFESLLDAFTNADMRIVGRKDEGKKIVYLWIPGTCDEDCAECQRAVDKANQWLIRDNWFDIVPRIALAALRGHIDEVKEDGNLLVRFEVIRISATDWQWDEWRRVIRATGLGFVEHASRFVPFTGADPVTPGSAN